LFRFVTIFNEKSANVYETHQDVQRLLEQIQYQHETASKLEKELQHEKTVLEERLKVFDFDFNLFFKINHLRVPNVC